MADAENAVVFRVIAAAGESNASTGLRRIADKLLFDLANH
jgi:hypothetical protein